MSNDLTIHVEQREQPFGRIRYFASIDFRNSEYMGDECRDARSAIETAMESLLDHMSVAAIAPFTIEVRTMPTVWGTA